MRFVNKTSATVSNSNHVLSIATDKESTICMVEIFSFSLSASLSHIHTNACAQTVSTVNTEQLHYLQDSDIQVDILHLPGTRCPAGGLHNSVDTAWHMTQIPGLVGMFSHLKNGKIYHAPSKMPIRGWADF